MVFVALVLLVTMVFRDIMVDLFCVRRLERLSVKGVHLVRKVFGCEVIEVVFWLFGPCCIRDVRFHHGLGGLGLSFKVFDSVWGVCNPDDDDILKYPVHTHALYH